MIKRSSRKDGYSFVHPLVGFVLGGCLVWINQPSLMIDLGSSLFSAECPVVAKVSAEGNDSRTTTLVDVDKMLIGPDSHGQGCPRGCGCPQARKDCPQWYSIQAIQASAAESDPKVLAHHATLLKEAKIKAEAACSNLGGNAQSNGGWCLEPNSNGKSIDFPHLKISYPMSHHHVKASQRIVTELLDLFQTENVSSVNDFGAGIAQYKSPLTHKLPHLEYHAYDGAGNGHNYTHGMLDYFDLTIPLDLPVTDWVMSLEVGEHVPSKYEGMLIRNLHRHNRKGIILSWGILGQGGHAHINLHRNEYVIGVFDALGYAHDVELSNRMRQPQGNYQWFQNSVMVFRRHSSQSYQ